MSEIIRFNVLIRGEEKAFRVLLKNDAQEIIKQHCSTHGYIGIKEETQIFLWQNLKIKVFWGTISTRGEFDNPEFLGSLRASSKRVALLWATPMGKSHGLWTGK